MGVNSLPNTVTRQRRDCDLNPGPSAPESSTLTTRLPSHPTCLGMSYSTADRLLSTTAKGRHSEEIRWGRLKTWDIVLKHNGILGLIS